MKYSKKEKLQKIVELIESIQVSSMLDDGFSYSDHSLSGVNGHTTILRCGRRYFEGAGYYWFSQWQGGCDQEPSFLGDTAEEAAEKLLKANQWRPIKKSLLNESKAFI